MTVGETGARFDAVELEITRGRLQSIVDEAGSVLVKTAFSQIVREAKDLACVILTPTGQTVAQVSGVPVFLGTTTNTTQRLLEILPPEAWQPDVVIGTNLVWIGTGHLFDVTLVQPVFVEGEMVAIVAVVVHVGDVGGRGWGRDARQIFEEGIQIPPAVIGTSEGFDPLFDAMVRANVRLPGEVTGDLNAALNALVVMRRQLVTLIGEITPAGFSRTCEELVTRTEAVVRERLSLVPDGTYRSSFDSDDVNGISFHLELAVTVEGDRILFDFAGSSPQVEAGINCYLPYVRGYITWSMKCLVAPDLPLNEGTVRPIEVSAPEGSIVNARPPAPSASRHVVGMHIPTLIFRAVSNAMPGAVIADSTAPNPVILISGTDPKTGKMFSSSFMEVPGGMGARATTDGLSAVQFPSNTRIIGVETIEATSPLLFHRREMIRDTGGAGRTRGGLGQHVSMEVLSAPAYASVMVERLQNPPLGVHGGLPGSCTRVLVDGEVVSDVSQRIRLEEGTVLVVESAGGGGYGDSSERPAEAIARDVEFGFVSGPR